MQILNGKEMASEIIENVKDKVAKLSRPICFTDVVVGDDKASMQYALMKKKRAEAVGIKWIDAFLPGTATTEEVINKIEELNKVENIAGIIVQLPLPSGIDTQKVLNAVGPKLDVDCIGENCKNNFYSNNPTFIFPTAKAVLYLLEKSGLKLEDKNIVIVGEGELVGKPVAHLLRTKNLNVTTVNTKTENKDELIKNADILISATGVPNLIKGDMLKQGALVIDAGTSESNGSVVGDVETETLENMDITLAPSPGGVGPLTVAFLLENILISNAK